MSKIFLKLTIHHNRQQDENKYCSSRTPGHNLTFRIIGGFPKNLWKKMELFRIPCYFWNWGFKLSKGGNSYIIARMPLKKNIFSSPHTLFSTYFACILTCILGDPPYNDKLLPHASCITRPSQFHN